MPQWTPTGLRPRPISSTEPPRPTVAPLPRGCCRPGPPALQFNGSQSVAIPKPLVPTNNQPYTIEAWINPASMGARGVVGWGSYGAGGQVTGAAFNSDGLMNYWWGNDLVVSTPDLSKTWHHVAASFDGATRKIYLDGALMGHRLARLGP